jgi:hypothetical protein
MNTQVVLYTDMIGYKSLSISNADNKEDFNAIALDTQNNVALELLGAELFNAFSTDLDAGSGTPTEQKWLDLLNGVTWTEVVNENDSDEDVVRNNKGIKEAWNYFVYREWLNQVPFVSNFTGKKTNNSINGETLDRQSLNVETQNRYNQGVDIYETVRCFVEYYKDYKVDYTSIVEVAGTYTVSLADTTYLKVGDKVTIDGNDYTVTVLTPDTSFEFVAATGLSFSNDYVEWYPFEDALNGKKGKLYFNGMF